MASKAELLASARKKGQKQQIFRRGRGTTTSVRQPAVRAAGKDAKAVSDFLGTMLKFGPGVLDAHNRETNEENKKLVAKGEATYKNATPAQRKQFRDNVRNGTISGGESPYFREGLKRSHAGSMALEYGNSVMLAWESSEAKNSADPEAFNNFLDEFQHKAEGPPGMNRSWQERVGDLGDHVANEEFWPKADAIKRQLSQTHSQHQRTEYNKKAQDQKDQAEAVKLNSVTPGVVAEQKVDEKILDDLVIGRRNILNSNMKVPRIPRDTSTETKFINNYVHALGPRKYRSRQEGKKEYDRKVSSISASLDHLIKVEGGEKVFSLAAFKKEEKETQRDLKLLAKKDRGYGVKSTKTSFTKVVSRPEIPPPSPIEVAEIEELNLASHIRGAPSKSGVYSLATPSAKVESDKQVDMSIMTALHGELKSKQQVETEVAEASNEPELEPEGDNENPVEQPSLKPEVKPAVTAQIVKAVEGIEPKRSHFGLIAYKTEDEAQRMVEKIRDGIVGDNTGTWEFAIIKVGDIYQVQTQGGATITDEQNKTFFNKLASEYPGQMGNLSAKPKDKDYVQIIKGQ